MRASWISCFALISSSVMLAGCAGAGAKQFVIGPLAPDMATIHAANVRGEGQAFFTSIDGVSRRNISVIRDYLLANPEIAFTPSSIEIAPGAHTFGVTYVLGDTAHVVLEKKSSKAYQIRYLSSVFDNEFITLRHHEDLSVTLSPGMSYVVSSHWNPKSGMIDFSIQECGLPDTECHDVGVVHSNLKDDAIPRMIQTGDAEWPVN